MGGQGKVRPIVKRKGLSSYARQARVYSEQGRCDWFSVSEGTFALEEEGAASDEEGATDLLKAGATGMGDGRYGRGRGRRDQ